MRHLLNQTNFPRLWLFFQYAVGGNVDKKRLLLKNYHGERKILEIGCSVGNVSDAFLSVNGITYQGLDIDTKAIALARQRFKKYPNFTFTCADLSLFSQTGQKFDLVYFAGVLHHMADDAALLLLRSVVPLLDVQTHLCILEPQPASDADPWLVRWYANTLERGQHLRSAVALRALVSAVPGLKIQSIQLTPIGATPFSWPLCANFIVMEACLSQGIDL